MAKNYFYNLLLTVTNLLFPLLSFPYVSRILGPEGIGKVQFVFSFAQYFALIASIGIPVYGMKEIAKYKNDKKGRSQVFSELLIIYLLSTVCLFLVYLSVIFVFPYFSADRGMYLGASLLVLLGFSYIDWVYTGLEEFKSIALRSVLFKIIGLLLLYFFVKNKSDTQNYLFIMIFSFLGNNILSFFFLKGKVSIMLSKLQLKRHLVPLFYILGTSLAASMYTDMDTVLLGFLSDSRAVGLYTAAVKLSKITLPFVTSMGVVLVPKISMYYAEKNMDEVQHTLNKAFRFLIFFAVPITFGLALLAPEFISLFSGEEFLPATNSMRLLSLLPLIIGLGHFFLYLVLIPAGKNREMFFCVLGGLTISLLLNIILIPLFKAEGSSIANIVSEISVTLLYVYFIGKYFKFAYDWLLFFKALVSCLIFIPVIWFSRSLSYDLIYTIILSIVGCSLTYILLQLLVFKNNFITEIWIFVKMKAGIKNKL
jgi:O-antigen/teichoic acid export membrane protein